MEVNQWFPEENQPVIAIFISTLAAKIINLSYFCSLYLILLTMIVIAFNQRTNKLTQNK
jgi:hypothetical protein